MCGRIACYLAPDDLSCSCKYRDVSGKESKVEWVPEKFQTVKYRPSYNMGPRDIVACIVAGSHFDEESERVLCPMMWGMIPPWHKGEAKKHNLSSHNARLENLSQSKLYGSPLSKGKRCAIVVNGFYEWKTDKETGKKQPYYIYKKAEDHGHSDEQQVLSLAGLFNRWTSEEGETIYSCTILTTNANDVLSWLHHRVPVIFQKDQDVRDWLNYKDVSAEKALGKIRRDKLLSSTLQWHPVSTIVNNVRNKDKSCIEAIELGNSRGKEKKSMSGQMSSWLKTGSKAGKKRKSTSGEDNHDAESSEPEEKARKKK